MAAEPSRVKPHNPRNPEDDRFQIHSFLIGTHVEQELLEPKQDPNDYLMVLDLSIPKFDLSSKYNDDEMMEFSAPKITWRAQHAGEVTKA